MNKRVAFAVLVLLVLTSGASAQVKSTLELFDQNISAELEKLYFVPEINRNLQIVFTVSGYGDSSKSRKERIAAGFLVSLIKKSAEKNRWQSSEGATRSATRRASLSSWMNCARCFSFNANMASG